MSSELDRVLASIREALDSIGGYLAKSDGPATQDQDVDPRDGIFLLENGKYWASVQIQDGYESCGEFNDRESAVEAYVNSAWVLNHVKVVNPLVYQVVRSEFPKCKYIRI